MIKGPRSVFGFLTIIPVGMDFDTEDVAKNAWMFPVVGGFIALIAAFLYESLSGILSDQIAAAIALFGLLILTGFHHLDGLLDFGDGLMRVGSAEGRRNAMRDVNTGVGGFAFGFFVLLVTYVALTETTMIFASLIVAEASAKFAMVLGAFVGKASHEGTGSVFTSNVDKKILLVSLFVYLLFLSVLPFDKLLMVFITACFTPLLVAAISSRLFEGVSGDVFGAINEITRAAVLVVLLL
jgi:adenosylcobinamide-GDP ribazoletransferase